MKYEVVVSRLWRRDDGHTASIYGALPWRAESEKARWAMVETGWTVRNPLTNEVGMGRVPFATKEAAQEFADRLGRPSRIGIGD